MNLDRHNQWLTLLANVGVLAGIVFLALEIQQNTSMIRSQTRDNIAEKQLVFRGWMGTDLATAEVYRLGSELQLDTSTPEYTQYRFLVSANFGFWANEWFHYDNGLFNDDEFGARTTNYKVLLEFPGYRQEWDYQRLNYPPRFREFVDNLVEEVEIESANGT